MKLSLRILGAVYVVIMLAVLLAVPASAQGAEATWRGEYFDNQFLSGSPLLVRQDANIAFDWGMGRPAPGLPADNFSVRWTRAINFESGRYRFTTTTDDGVRLFIDGNMVLDQWRPMSPTRHSVEIDLSAGVHVVRMEYFELTKTAVARLEIGKQFVPQPANTWRGEYYNNPYLAGGPVVVRDDTSLDFNWGVGGPAPNVQADNFSVRWTRASTFEPGRYQFTTVSDDGVRLYIDGNLVLDRWRPMAGEQHSVEVNLSAGTHTIRLEYYEATGTAAVKLSWNRLGAVAAPNTGSMWRGEYFNNTNLSGSPVLVRDDAKIDFNWGAGSPDKKVNKDNFSVRWSRSVNLPGGNYEFVTLSDDGVRLYVDDNLIIDQWRALSNKQFKRLVYLTAGTHTIRLEYFERTGDAAVKLRWVGPIAPATGGNLLTCVPPYPSYSWIKVYRMQDDGTWQDMNARGYASIESSGFLKIDGLPVNYARYGDAGHPYRVEQWVEGRLVRAVGADGNFRIKAGQDNATPWSCSR